MAQFLRPYKIHPEKPRAWTMEETRIPHRPNSASRPSRRDFQRAVINPAFQEQFNESRESVHEEDMEPTLMEVPQVQGPRRVTKRENINVTRECEWNVKDIKYDSLGGRTPLNRSLVAVLGVVCVTSFVSLLLTLLILSGTVGARNCSCGDSNGAGSTSAMKSEDDDRIEKFSENITTMEKRMEEQIKQVQKSCNEQNEELLRNEIEKLRTLLENQTIKLVEQTTSQAGQEFKNVWRVANESTKRLQSEMTSSMQVLQTKVDNEMETVWFHLNKSRKCCNNLTSTFLSFRKNVTYRSKRIEDRIEIEEQKSNNTSQVEEQHSKKIQGLENLLNVTRKDIKKVSREHFKTLWLAGNFTSAELRRVWTAMNLTQIDLLRQLKKVKDNLTEQLNLTKVHLQTSDASLFASLIDANASITKKVNNEMETVWFHLNKSKKCCNNLTTSLQSFKISVTHRSKTIEDRIEIEEQKSNNTSAVEEQHSMKIQGLENLLNNTRKDIKEVSREHFKTLWSAGNFTNAELRRVWTAVNSTQIDLLRQLKKVKDNFTEQLNLTTVHLQTYDASLFASLSEVNASITEKVNDVSKMAGPIGPPGHNGSQGPAGAAGSTGPPGPKGAGDFSSCKYKVVKDVDSPGDPINAVVAQTEPDGKRITGATCSTDFAAEYNMLTQLLATGKRRYVCNCKGNSALFRPRGDKNCYLHYWECPLTT